MSKINAKITGVAGHLPEYILTNDELSKMVDTSDEWIMTRIGIKERRIIKEKGKGTSDIAAKAVEKLFEKTNETINLGILDKQSVVYLDKIQSKEPLRIELNIGHEVPLYCSAMGKSIIAFNKDIQLEDMEYKHYTENTVTSNKELNAQLKEIRKKGYSLDDEEYIKGLICIAVPILDLEGKAVASVSVSLPAARLDEDKKEYYVSILKEATSKISKDLFF